MAATQNDTILIICPPCFQCGEEAEVEVDVKAFARWKAGEFIQVAFASMPTSEREVLISGIHPACWDAMFPLDDES